MTERKDDDIDGYLSHALSEAMQSRTFLAGSSNLERHSGHLNSTDVETFKRLYPRHKLATATRHAFHLYVKALAQHKEENKHAVSQQQG